ncbi:MAG: glycosyltransferase family 2 protein [Paludibacteraceae bacterium]|nr:glycosyltransferase family 2 protein [Paludibacteraceae bacterium]
MIPSVSIICPCYNEKLYIQDCINSIARQDYDLSQVEVLIIDGMSTDGTREIIRQMQQTYSWLHLIDNPRHIASTAMNIGLKQAQGEYIVRIDTHAVYPVSYISTLLHHLITLPNAQNVGAVCRTLPANDTPIAQAIALTISHKFGVGNSLFRVGVHQITETDTVPFGCWHKQWVNDLGGFDEELIRNQDDEFNARTIERGGKIYLIPNLSVDYYARPTLNKTWQMFYQYGLFKPLVNHKRNHPATLRQFIPPLFVLGLIPALPIYLCIIGGISLKYHNAALMLTFPTVHISYGIGYWIGLYKVLTHQSFIVQSNH